MTPVGVIGQFHGLKKVLSPEWFDPLRVLKEDELFGYIRFRKPHFFYWDAHGDRSGNYCEASNALGIPISRKG